jgi:2-polyprenyl-6-methoxyphenol hydroxylase-like FAD-dependent oxidoreductase
MSRSQDNQESTAVLIVGAGPTGLTLACELARRGISVRLIEASPGPQPGSRGKGIQPRTLEVFDDLGIVDRVIAHGRMAMPILKVAPDGHVSLEGNDPLIDRPDVPYPASLITPEWRIEEALRLRLAEFGCAVEFDTTLQRFEQSEERVSAVVLRAGVLETVNALWLVGCDGGHSLVRSQAGIAFDGETREEVRMIVADVVVDGLDRDSWYMWQHEEGFVTLCPLPSTKLFQFQASIAPQQPSELDLANLQQTLMRRSGRTDIRIQASEWSSLWRCNVRLAAQYRTGRVFLAGDSAHVHSPAGGQGMNTGIQDSYNFGWKLAAVIKGAAPALLDSYETERRPVAESVIELSNTRLEQAISRKNLPSKRDASTMQLGINYRDSALAHDDRGATARLRAGDRAPDVADLMTGEGKRRLFDLTRGERFTLLNFGAAATMDLRGHDLRLLHLVGERSGHDDIADPKGHLADTYGAGNRTLVLIRPDGYIGLISDSGDFSAVSDYLSAVRPGR